MFSKIEKSIFFLISVSFVLTAGNDVKDEGPDREAHSDRQGLWFGPRLGKRSLRMSDEDNRDLYLRMLEAADAMKFYYDQLPVSLIERNEPDTKVTKKVIFTPKLGRSAGDEPRYLEFTPRLGRRLAEELGVTVPDHEIYRGVDASGSRTRYFSPRLGRTMSFQPRLGRELNYDNYPSVRIARSVNNTKNSKN